MTGRRVRPGTDRIDDDGGVPKNEHGHAVAVCYDGGAMQVVRRRAEHQRKPAGCGRGKESEGSIPSPVPMCTHWVGWLLIPNGVRSQAFRVPDLPLARLRSPAGSSSSPPGSSCVPALSFGVLPRSFSLMRPMSRSPRSSLIRVRGRCGRPGRQGCPGWGSGTALPVTVVRARRWDPCSAPHVSLSRSDHLPTFDGLLLADRPAGAGSVAGWRVWRLAGSGSGIVGQLPAWSARGAGVKASSPPLAGRRDRGEP